MVCHDRSSNVSMCK